MLVIEEVSMISGEFLDCLSAVVAEIRGEPELPFGGLQLIVSGDFLQLLPIVGNVAYHYVTSVATLGKGA